MRTTTWKKFVAVALMFLSASLPAIAQSGCVIPGATTIVQSSSWSPLAADTGKIYVVTGTATATLPNTPPTAVWRFDAIVVTGGKLTINPGTASIDGLTAGTTETFYSGSSVRVSTDGTNYWTSDKGYTIRTCDIAIGDESSSSALTNAQLGPQSRLCYVPDTAIITEIAVAADGGTPNVIVGRNHAGTISNLVSSALATAAGGGIACSNAAGAVGRDGATTCSGTLQNTTLSPGDYIELVSGTAGGTAKLMTIHVIYVVHNEA